MLKGQDITGSKMSLTNESSIVEPEKIDFKPIYQRTDPEIIEADNALRKKKEV